MKASEIDLMRIYLCTLDKSLPYPNYNEVKLNSEDALYGYLQKLVYGALGNVTAAEASFTAEDELDKLVTDDPADLEPFVNITAEKMYDIIKDTTELTSGAGAFLFCVAEDQPYVCFFRMKYREFFTLKLAEDGMVSWPLNTKVLPSGGTKDLEFFVINVYERTVRLSDSTATVNDIRMNYLAEAVLGLKTKPSEKEKVEAIRDTTVETIRECYTEPEVPQKIMEYKTEVAKQAEATGRVSAVEIESRVFSDNEQAKEVFREKLKEEDISVNPVPVSKKTERALCRKQRIITDNGIELLVPVDYLKNEQYVEYLQDEEGNISIILKSIKNITA